jgi:hypothetical protein
LDLFLDNLRRALFFFSYLHDHGPCNGAKIKRPIDQGSLPFAGIALDQSRAAVPAHGIADRSRDSIKQLATLDPG